jgi:hypothetical protein
MNDESNRNLMEIKIHENKIGSYQNMWHDTGKIMPRRKSALSKVLDNKNGMKSVT